jgi:hypothetical protein
LEGGLVGPALKKLDAILKKRLQDSDKVKKQLPLLSGFYVSFVTDIHKEEKVDALLKVLACLEEAAHIDELLMGELKKRRNRNPLKPETYGKI